MANSHQRNNAIEMLHSDGCVISSPHQDLIEHYYDLLTELASWNPKIGELVFYSLNPLSESWLEKLFDEDGVF